MRGPKPTHPVNLIAEEVKSFQQLIRAHSTPQAVAVRARSILSRTTNRSPKRLVPPIAPCASGADAGWRPERSPTRRAVGRQGVFPPQVRAQVTAIACSLPKQCQVPLSRWSRAELARHVVQDPSLPPISASTVGRWLKARSLATVLRESPK
jgi:hypothetical protein